MIDCLEDNGSHVPCGFVPAPAAVQPQTTRSTCMPGSAVGLMLSRHCHVLMGRSSHDFTSANDQINSAWNQMLAILSLAFVPILSAELQCRHLIPVGGLVRFFRLTARVALTEGGGPRHGHVRER